MVTKSSSRAVRTGALCALIAGALWPAMPASLAARGDRLYTASDATAVRTSPSARAARLLVLPRGHLLVEAQSSGRWLRVGVARSGGKVGWVRRSDLSTIRMSPETVPSGRALETFLLDVEAFNQGLMDELDMQLFSHIEAPIPDMIHLTVTDGWHAMDSRARVRVLARLADRWAALNGGDRPTWVEAVDADGRVLARARRGR